MVQLSLKKLIELQIKETRKFHEMKDIHNKIDINLDERLSDAEALKTSNSRSLFIVHSSSAPQITINASSSVSQVKGCVVSAVPGKPDSWAEECRQSSCLPPQVQPVTLLEAVVE